jgi:hypothetical protein
MLPVVSRTKTTSTFGRGGGAAASSARSGDDSISAIERAIASLGACSIGSSFPGASSRGSPTQTLIPRGEFPDRSRGAPDPC